MPEQADATPAQDPAAPEGIGEAEQVLAAVGELQAERAVLGAVETLLEDHRLVVVEQRAGLVGLAPDVHKDVAISVNRSHLDCAVPPSTARDFAQQHGFVRQRSNPTTTIIRVSALHLASHSKREAWLELVEAALEHRREGPDRAVRERKRVQVPVAKAARTPAPRTAAAPRAPAKPEPPAAVLCPVHGTEMLGGTCDRCD